METGLLGQLTEDEESKYYLTLGSGGAAALLAGIGACLGCRMAGLNRFRMVGGASAGSIIASLVSLGLDSSRLLHIGLDTDFQQHVRMFRNLLPRPRTNIDNDAPRAWRCTGLLDISGLATFIQELSAAAARDGGSCPCTWPEQFWTIGTTGDGSPVIFKNDGVWLIEKNNQVTRLSDTPVALHDAVCISCSIPGVITSYRYKGRFLHDGALSRDGVCPVGIQIRHFNTDPRKIIACHVGADLHEPVSGRFHSLCRASWGVNPERHWGPETAGVVEFRPPITHVHTLKFHLSRDEKWLAILLSFDACVSRLALEGILAGEDLFKTQCLLRELACWKNVIPAECGKPQLFSQRAEACLSEYGLY